MAQPWQPQEAGVLQLCNILGQVQQTGANQGQILQQLEQYKAYPDFNNYLAFIFSQGETLPVEVRQSAGLLLKNNLKQQYATTSEDLKAFIKGTLLHVLPHPQRALRQTAGTIFSVIVGASGLASWPDLVTAIGQALQSQDSNALNGGLDTLYKIIEDNPTEIDVQVALGGQQHYVSVLLVPVLLQLLRCQEAGVRRQALACLNMMAEGMPKGLQDNISAYVEGMFALALDTSSDVRREVCLGLVKGMMLMPERLSPFLHNIIEYMLESNQHTDKGVAMESCEFWIAFCDLQIEQEVLKPFLPRLIPVLMRNMVFEEDDEGVEEAEAAEDEVAQQQQDRDQDVRPFHSKSRDVAGGSGGEGPGEASGGDDNDDDDEEDVMNKWNLRKCSAAGLDRLSLTFGDELLPVLLPIVEERLKQDDWRARESAILALGAVSEGCHRGLLPYLEGIISMLLPKMADPRPMVRVISCWALGRYSFWLLAGWQERQGSNRTLDTAVSSILARVLDPNKFVQEAACSALATLEDVAAQEEAAGALEPYLQTILEHLAVACTKYSRRNMRVLYDALGTLAEAAGPMRMSKPQLVQTYMPVLYQKFLSLPPQERDQLPLMECLTTLLAMIKHQGEPFAKGLFDKIMQILSMQMEARAASRSGVPHPLEYDRDLVVCSLDLASGLSEGLGKAVEALVVGSRLMEVTVGCCSDEASDVRQSAFALVGDLSRACIRQVEPRMAELLPAALANLAPQHLVEDNMRACNNACWSLGEMAIKLPAQLLQSYAGRVAEVTAHILAARSSRSLPRSIIENSAITLGRVAMICPGEIAPHLGHFCTNWCRALREIRDDIEKEHAYIGLCRLVRLNPDAALPSFASMCAAFVSWRKVNDEILRNEMIQIVLHFRDKLSQAGTWEAAAATLELPVRQKLSSMCQQQL